MYEEMDRITNRLLKVQDNVNRLAVHNKNPSLFQNNDILDEKIEEYRISLDSILPKKSQIHTGK